MKVDLPSLVSRFVELRRQGQSWVGRCPFHDDGVPSFSVYEDHFHCFGCGVHGNAVEFVRRFGGVPRAIALAYLAQVPHSKSPRPTKRKSSNLSLPQLERQLEMYKGNQSSAQHYLEARGVLPEAAERFELGVHAQRLMIPVRNANGLLVGFTGRAMRGQPSKYRNSTGLPLSKVLFGLHLLPTSVELYVVEGYFDTITLQQAGLPAVATGRRVEFTRAQLKLLKGRRVVLIPDGDESGRTGGSRGHQQLLEAGIKVQMVALPDGEDPDSVVRDQGPDALERLVRP